MSLRYVRRLIVLKTLQLLHAVVRLMVENHAFAHYLNRLEFLEHNRFAALCADAAGEVVGLFTICQRGTRGL